MSEATSEDAHEQRLELLREAVTMALYISLSLLAVLAAIPSSAAESNDALPYLVLWTAIGLVLAHQLAFRLSTRLVSHGRIEGLAPKLLLAQLVGGAVAVVLGAGPVFLFGSHALIWSELLLLTMVAVVGYLAARSVPVSRLRALGYVGLVVLAVFAVLAVKSLAGH